MKFAIALGLLSLLSAFKALSAEEYQLKGLYVLDGSAEAPVGFVLKWKEEKGKIDGEYADTHFAKSAPLSGTRSDEGRSFKVSFVETIKGVKSILIHVAALGSKATATTVPVSILTRDENGTPLTTTKGSASFLGETQIRTAQRQDEAPKKQNEQTKQKQQRQEETGSCVDNFGVLAGFCGLYGGLVSEETDLSKNCHLLRTQAVRLELDETGSLRLYLDQPANAVTRPAHDLGRLPADPESRTIDLINRECRPLQGTELPGDHCKRLNLQGTFTAGVDEPHFTGTYSIVDEETGNFCKYGLSLDRLEN